MTETYSSDCRMLEVRRLGVIPYAEALELQASLVDDRREGRIPDQLLLVEHPHVITVGASGDARHVLSDEAERALLGVELFEVGRGGDATYHGPGQLVGYPVLDLKPDAKDLRGYLRRLEQVLIATVASLGVDAHAVDGLTGVWVGDAKLAAIGVRVSSGWITSHGFALNVSTDLRYFDTIVPCGLEDRSVTSLSEVLGRAVTMEDAAKAVVEAFVRLFDLKVVVV